MAAGHRRNGSEYVGGDITNGGPMLVSTSPVKDSQESETSTNPESGVDSKTGSSMLVGLRQPNTKETTYPVSSARLGPPATRRGHAHRRSGAISSHDLSMILKPTAEGKPGSAPTTPSDPIFDIPSPPVLDRSTSQPVLAMAGQTTSTTSDSQESSNTGGTPRPRTRFSELVEYIPRPLSTISSETSSSMSTIRASHSVTNSISSVVSASASSHLLNNHPKDCSQQDPEQSESEHRPRTAEGTSGASLANWEREHSESESAIKRPSSAPSGDILNNSIEAKSGTLAQKPLQSPNQIQADTFLQFAAQSASTECASPQSLRRRPVPRLDLSPIRPRTSPEPEVTKRQRKGKSWTDLLSRKGKIQDHNQGFGCNHPTTSSSSQLPPEKEGFVDNMSFDIDSTCIIETGSPYNSKLSGITADHAHFKPRESSPLPEGGASPSVLDIDAALGSFDDPGVGPSFEDVVGTESTAAPRRMHSSGTTGSFAGPGMHYRRRAESAPEMEAIDRSRFGFPRLGSNPAMAIEEEDEEEDEEDVAAIQLGETTRPSLGEVGEGSAPGLGVNIVEADNVHDQPMQRVSQGPIQRTNADLAIPSRAARLEYWEEVGQVEIVGPDEEPRFSMITKSSDESTITPTLSHDPLTANLESTPPAFAMPTSALTNSSSDSPSALSSPDFTRSSFDVPRMHTANSSITDRTTLNSSRAGDHDPGLHGSVDDVPSLTSSASTMSAHPTRFSSGANSAGDRSASLSAAVPRRTRPDSAHKRLSLASLSRLTGSSYNKSKLNIEESAPDDTVERKEKKKGNRISRMMKFWKSKEKVSYP